MACWRLAAVLVIAMIMAKSNSAYAQISTPCNATMLSSAAPCMNFLTGSSATGSSPTADCCNALRNLIGDGMNCLCLIVTGNVPFRIPNRNVAVSLPRACNLPGVPVQCKTSGAPLPTPGPVSLGPSPSHAGPVSLGPSPSPGLAPYPSPKASVVPEPVAPAPPPQSDATLPFTPPSPTVDSEAPTVPTGSGPAVLNPSSDSSAAAFSYSFSSLSLLIVAVLSGTVLLDYYDY